MMNVSCAVGQMSVQNVHQRQQHTIERSLLRNDRIALSMSSCGKSFHIDSKAIFSWAMLVDFGMYF